MGPRSLQIFRWIFDWRGYRGRDELVGVRAQTANFVVTGPRRDPRDHIWCCLPGEAAGRCVPAISLFLIRLEPWIGSSTVAFKLG